MRNRQNILFMVGKRGKNMGGLRCTAYDSTHPQSQWCHLFRSVHPDASEKAGIWRIGWAGKQHAFSLTKFSEPEI